MYCIFTLKLTFNINYTYVPNAKASTSSNTSHAIATLLQPILHNISSIHDFNVTSPSVCNEHITDYNACIWMLASCIKFLSPCIHEDKHLALPYLQSICKQLTSFAVRRELSTNENVVEGFSRLCHVTIMSLGEHAASLLPITIDAIVTLFTMTRSSLCFEPLKTAFKIFGKCADLSNSFHVLLTQMSEKVFSMLVSDFVSNVILMDLYISYDLIESVVSLYV